MKESDKYKFSTDKLPKHITIIMDGNGRWAKQQHHERLFGHNAGVESVRDTVTYAAEIGIKYLSLYAFSSENWNRPKDEVDGLMSLMFQAIHKERDTIMKNNIKFRVIGDRFKLSEKLLKDIEHLEEESVNNTRMTLILFISYSGRWDIMQAVNKCIKVSKQQVTDALLFNDSINENPALIDEKTFEKYLATADIPDPDLMIRTSGETRISNYLLWQLAYTELYFLDILWPDFRMKDLKKAIENYVNRERRFGKTSEQLNNK
ncbi:MAG: polyprenyl diphosphate synthase [Bacteroidales bacterium]